MWMVECSSETRHAIRWLLRVRPTCDLAAPIVVFWKTENWRTRIGRAQCKSLRIPFPSLPFPSLPFRCTN